MILFSEARQLTALDLPDCKLLENGKPRSAQLITNANFDLVASNLGLTFAHNQMTGKPELAHNGSVLSDEGDCERALNALEDSFKNLDASGGLGGLRSVLSAAAHRNTYHPMRDYLNALPEHDGRDYIAEVAGAVSTGSALMEVYLRKWLVQVCAGVMNTTKADMPLPYCLVFSGAQGLGKTYFFRELNPAFMKSEAELQLNGAGGKDHAITALGNAMVEISEIDACFRKADTAVLKAFLSRGVDEIRVPYARAPVVRTRRTVFCASVNTTDFLNDPTGARRFWPVRVDKIDRDFKLDVDRLWAHALSNFVANPNFELSAAETKIKAEEHFEFQSVPLEEDIIATHFSRYGDNYESYYALTISEIVAALGIKGANRAVVSSVKRWLTEERGAARTIKGLRGCWAVPLTADGFARLQSSAPARLSETEAKKLTIWGEA